MALPGVSSNRGKFADRFEHLEMVGKGSMGTVYRAWDEGTHTLVALKILNAPATSERFEREAAILASLEHEHIVAYVAHGVTRSGSAWLAMEWLDGEDLESYLERNGALTIEDTIVLARGVASALAWAHLSGLVHRDLKPANLFLPNGRLESAMVLDFGLAHVTEDTGFTTTGTMMGTLLYMAPEQALDAKRVDARADVFSLGAVLHACLTGSPADDANDRQLIARLFEPKPRVTDLRPETPAPLADLLASMLAVDRCGRPATGAEVLEALDALGPITVSPWESTVVMSKHPVDVTLAMPTPSAAERTVVLPRSHRAPATLYSARNPAMPTPPSSPCVPPPPYAHAPWVPPVPALPPPSTPVPSSAGGGTLLSSIPVSSHRPTRSGVVPVAARSPWLDGVVLGVVAALTLLAIAGWVAFAAR